MTADTALDRDRLTAALDAILDTLIADYVVTTTSDERRGAVLHSTFDRPTEYGVDTELLRTNYYLAYTLHCLLR